MTPIVIAGPTGAGKSDVALALAARRRGAIVCGDSRQVYAGMRVASAGPSVDDEARAPHFGFHALPPEAPFTAGDFVAACDAWIDAAAAAGATPFVVGGSGLYLRAWRHGLDDAPPADAAVRAGLEGERARLGTAALHARLAAVDPAAAAKIEPVDAVRVVRALEIFALTGRKPSELRASHGRRDAPGAVRRDARFILLEAPMEWLEPRLRARARAMFAAGLVDEARALRARLPAGHKLLATMGVEEALQVADGEATVDAAVDAVARRQRAYARRQRTWFRGEPWWQRFDASRDDLVDAIDRSLFASTTSIAMPRGMRPLVEPFLRELSAYVPGKPIEETEREYGVANIAKLASNENCLGPSPKAIAAAQKALASAHLYPDAGGFYLKRRLCERHAAQGVRPEQIVLGNGTNEIIQLVVRAFCCADEAILNAWPSFVVYRLAAKAKGRLEVAVPLARDHAYDLDGMIAALQASKVPVKVAFLANPNNPTGTYVGRDALERFVARLPDDVVLVLDEAYAEYATVADYPDGIALAMRRPRTVVLRTFSKIFGLAGLRIGYAVGDVEVIEVLDRLRDPFNTGAIAQAAALAALDDEEHARRSRDHVARELPRLTAGLRARGFAVAPSIANFVLADVPAQITAKQLDVELLKRGVIVRPVANYGLPNSVRITVGTVEEDDRLLRALDAVLA